MARAQRTKRHIRSRAIQQRMLSGILLLVPFVVTAIVVIWLFAWLKRLLLPALKALFAVTEILPTFERLPERSVRLIVSGTAILLLLFVIYAVGSIGTKVFGRRLISRFESLLKRIPLAGVLYGASRQVVETFSAGDRPAYKSVVLVDFPYPGSKAIGFLTGHMKGDDGQQYAKVFVPTTPSPVTGFLVIQPLKNVVHTGMPVEEAFKMILSGGLISPEKLPLTQIAIHGKHENLRENAD